MLIDSNILIYSLNNSSPKQLVAQDFLNKNQSKLIFAQQNKFESLRILTHSKFPSPFTIGAAIKAIEAVTSGSRVIYPDLQTEALTYELVRKYSIAGSEMFDAYLVATALSNGVSQIATDNVKHLKKYKEIEVVNPFI